MILEAPLCRPQILKGAVESDSKNHRRRCCILWAKKKYEEKVSLLLFLTSSEKDIYKQMQQLYNKNAIWLDQNFSAALVEYCCPSYYYIFDDDDDVVIHVSQSSSRDFASLK
mmetsp:Transcript_25918/g.38964  ORF Transcript_25918/g.38964 Transcript_25918/m.38964 type:complete len:112 (+) Transcript_25918:118-453(+)